MECEHKWEEVIEEREKEYVLYNPNGEYVEGIGWDHVFIPLERPKEYRCEKCHSLKRGEFIFESLPKPHNVTHIDKKTGCFLLEDLES